MSVQRGCSRRVLLRRGIMLGLAAPATTLVGRRADADEAAREAARLAMASAGASMPSLSNATMMVAGPGHAGTARLAEQLAAPLSATLHPGRTLNIDAVGGRDGVTGANAFEALSNPDGSTALLVPGAAAMAWLAGDRRVHFDAGRWVPALTSVSSAVLVGRAGPHPSALRVAASTPSGIELAALLGLSLLGATPSPVFGLADSEDAGTALREGRVDAVLLAGRDVPARAAVLCGPGSGLALRPIFALGGGSDAAARDPALPTVPTLPELYRGTFGRAPSGVLFAAWTSTAAAARLDAALVLQPLTPAALVAQWRTACGNAVASPALARDARKAQLDPLAAPQCLSALSAVVAGENTLLALRRWIAGRTDWRPA